PINRDAAAAHVIEPRNEIRGCRLPRARVADECRELSGRHLERDVTERGRVLDVAERHMLEREVAAWPFECYRARFVRDLLVQVEVIEQPLEQRERTEHRDVRVRELRDRL